MHFAHGSMILFIVPTIFEENDRMFGFILQTNFVF